MLSILESKLIRTLLSYLAAGISLIPIALVYAFLKHNNVLDQMWYLGFLALGGIIGYLAREKYEKVLARILVRKKIQEQLPTATSNDVPVLHQITSLSATDLFLFISTSPQKIQPKLVIITEHSIPAKAGETLVYQS